MIVVEGPDGAGKSTIVRALAKDFGLRIADHGERSALPHGDIRRRVYSALGDTVRGDGPVLIHDRLFFSELVYGNILRGKTQFSTGEESYIFRVLKAVGCPIIFCLPPLDHVAANVQGGDHIDGVKDNIYEIYGQYYDLARTAKLNGIWAVTYDYTNLLDTDLVQVMNNYLNSRRARTWG